MQDPFAAIALIVIPAFAAVALLAMGPAPEHRRALDVTQMNVVGVGCGAPEQQKRIFIAVEEDDLPGPTCEVVFSLYDPRG